MQDDIKIRGPEDQKINEYFEEEVWGKLMHCVLEKVFQLRRLLYHVVYNKLCSVLWNHKPMKKMN